MLISCFFLLYKLKLSPFLWIVNVDDNINIFKYFIDNVYSDEEIYYIVEKKVENIDNYLTNFKRFTLYKKDKNDNIIYQSI
jgi:hypothetical protein